MKGRVSMKEGASDKIPSLNSLGVGIVSNISGIINSSLLIIYYVSKCTRVCMCMYVCTCVCACM